MTDDATTEAERDAAFEQKLGSYLQANGVLAEHLRFEARCHSVEEAARAANADPTHFVKSVCLAFPDGRFVVAIVKGEDRVSLSRVARALGSEEPRLATAEEVLRRTGYPAGGVPPFGFPAEFVVDARVLERPWVYAGGGSGRALVRVATAEILRAAKARVAVVRR